MTAPAPPRPIREEVARAIVEAAIASGQRGIPNWDHAHLYERHGRTFREVALMEADAALAVIRARFEQPTPEMTAAAVRAFYEGRRPMPDAIAAAAKVALGDAP